MTKKIRAAVLSGSRRKKFALAPGGHTEHLGQGTGVTGLRFHYVQCWTWHPLATRQAGVMQPKVSASVEARF